MSVHRIWKVFIAFLVVKRSAARRGDTMVLVASETFLAQVAAFYDGAQESKGTVTVTCKSGG